MEKYICQQFIPKKPKKIRYFIIYNINNTCIINT